MAARAFTGPFGGHQRNRIFHHRRFYPGRQTCVGDGYCHDGLFRGGLYWCAGGPQAGAVANLAFPVYCAYGPVRISVCGHPDVCAAPQRSPRKSKAGGGQLFRDLLTDANLQRALLLSVFLIVGQFSIVPLIASFMRNIMLTEDQVVLLYIIGGACTIVSSPLIGRRADRRASPGFLYG